MDNVNLSSEALLSNQGDMTSFRYSNSNIQFRTPKCLKRYTEVKEWDNEYIVCIGHSCYWAGNKPDLPVLTCFLRTAQKMPLLKIYGTCATF